ncbi:carbamoyl transferase [Paenibacillus sp. MER TA 81-3]|uniref:carbamoyl transferase n=1 Tax=Paenibacillus sp. MER TA 81-3 TaxID=2939573 RepID=UPI002041F23B|nr:carbamoyl transferase [Paenibacillus sp. MER TA 81-3]MCM3342217.1 carbamoyl transferase [Paenibacillus sp. MER TA 81-3]
MKAYIRTGWDWLKEHVYIWVILFLYQLLWGFFVYRFIDGIVLPVLLRYPNPAPTEMSSQLFLIESQFHLSKTNDYAPYLWIVVGCMAIRMLLTPFIEAGLFYAIAHPRQSGLTFFQGIKVVWKPMLLLYTIKTVLLLAPAYWFVPYAAHVLTTKSTIASLLASVAPFVLIWAICGWIFHHLFLFMQFGAASELSLLQSVTAGVRRMLPILGLSLIFMGLVLVISLLFTTAAMFWTGMTALILQQAFPAVRAVCKMWGVSARYAIWQEANQQSK